MIRWLAPAILLLLIAAGCAETAPDRREAEAPEIEREFPGLEVNPPDTYRYMQRPDEADDEARQLPAQ